MKAMFFRTRWVGLVKNPKAINANFSNAVADNYGSAMAVAA